MLCYLQRKKELAKIYCPEHINVSSVSHQCILRISSMNPPHLINVSSVSYPPYLINVSSASHLCQPTRMSFSACYSKMHIDVDLIVLHRFTFVISIFANCKSYALVIGLIKNILTYLHITCLTLQWLHHYQPIPVLL